MPLLMIDVHQHGTQLVGTLRRPDDLSGIDFWGVLELVVAIEALLAPEPSPPFRQTRDPTDEHA